MRFWSFAALTLVVAACGGDDDDDSSASDTTVEETPEFAAGTTMASLADAGSIRIGTKFDQPGLGNINLETNEPEGFDVEIGKIVAGKLGISEDDIEWVETISANREAFIAGDRVDIVIATYTINDARKEQVDFAGPYYVAGQDLLVREDDDSINGPGRPRRQAGVCGHRLDADPEDPRRSIPKPSPSSSTRTPSASTSSKPARSTR